MTSRAQPTDEWYYQQTPKWLSHTLGSAKYSSDVGKPFSLHDPSMHRYTAVTSWARDGAPFTDMRYSRAHRWKFDGGVELTGSSSPQHVRVPFSDPAAVDPEEALVAALSSCHLLSFLYVAAKRGYVVESYVDEAEGVMGKNDEGRLAITRVVLRPRVAYATTPDAETEAAMHHQAHDDCYISNSVRTEVIVEPVPA